MNFRSCYEYLQNIIDRAARRAGYVRKPAHPLKRSHFFDLYFSRVDPAAFFFLQIGAGDGVLADPLYPYVTKYRLAGLALEPLPGSFERLGDAYRGYSVRLRRAALVEETGPVAIFAPASDDPALNSLASLDEDVVRRTLRQQANTKDVSVERNEVEGISFEDLSRQEDVKRINFLQLDCEGADWRLLKTFDIARWKPDIINFESYLLSEADKRESRMWLERNGYRFFESGYDTCAYRL